MKLKSNIDFQRVKSLIQLHTNNSYRLFDLYGYGKAKVRKQIIDLMYKNEIHISHCTLSLIEKGIVQILGIPLYESNESDIASYLSKWTRKKYVNIESVIEIIIEATL